ncbi:hypothetical protein SEA_NERGAL_2 [Mycobacterium Phage Nergal]|nr:hypothetical protein SEA_NERGAL_2 [Mycobacterium Phage Nergal]
MTHPTAADYAADAARSAQAGVDRLERQLAAMTAPAPKPNTHDDIEHRFSYHPATTPARQAQHEAVRAACKRLAHALDRIVPPGRHKSLALTAVEEAMHWANAAVACQVAPPPEPEPLGVDPAKLAAHAELVADDDEPETVHVVPTPPDAIEHLTDNGPVCPCNPRIEPARGGGLVIVHNAADGRP